VSKNERTRIAVTLILLFGFCLFYYGTDGFRAFTAESARVYQLLEDQPRFPVVELEDSEGRTYPISDFQGKYMLVTFFYSSCPSVCIELERNMSLVYDRIPKAYFDQDIVFLSISFDPDRDDPA